MSPMRYLRLVRLHTARRLLTRATPTTTTTVTELTQRLRFSSPSRFASTYQAQFGELPSVTLRFLRASGYAVGTPVRVIAPGRHHRE